MSISAKDVMSLRKSTGAGMMDCKEALKESGGDLDGALQWLAKKGAKVAAKRADRDATEGIVVILGDDKKALAMALSCETDFVAKNDEFISFANSLAQLAVDKDAKTAEELLACEFDGATVAEKLESEPARSVRSLKFLTCKSSKAEQSLSTFTRAARSAYLYLTKTAETRRDLSSSAALPCTLRQ